MYAGRVDVESEVGRWAVCKCWEATHASLWWGGSIAEVRPYTSQLREAVLLFRHKLKLECALSGASATEFAGRIAVAGGRAMRISFAWQDRGRGAKLRWIRNLSLCLC